MKNIKPEISFNQFLDIEKLLDIRIGRVTEAIRVPKSDKMLQLLVDFGNEQRTVMTNIGNRISDERYLIGLQFPFIVNVAPAKIMGVMSSAVIMPVENIETGVLELAHEHYSNGSKLF